PVPGGADREALVERDHGGVAGPAPVLDVAHRVPAARVLVPAGAPVVGVAQHVAEEARVLRRARPDHGRSCWTSWRRLPSGSKTSTTRTSSWSSSTVPTSTFSVRCLSALPFTYSMSTVAYVPPSVG